MAPAPRAAAAALMVTQLGCQPAEVPVEDTASAAPATPTQYSYDPPEDSEAEVDLTAIEAALAVVLPSLPRLDAGELIAAYDSFLDAADEGCPAWYENEGNLFWYASCTSDAGTRFDGYGSKTVYEDIEAYDDGGIYNGEYLYGLSTLEDAEGRYLHLAGSAYELVGTYDLSDYSYTTFQMAIIGSAIYQGLDDAGGWLTGTVDPDLSFYAYVLPDYDMRYMLIDGQVSGLETLAPALSSLDLDTVHYGAAAAGWPCPEELGGTISARQPDGAWIDIRFDVDTDWVLTGTCDGCGAAMRGDTYLGEVCVDPTPLIDFEETPW